MAKKYVKLGVVLQNDKGPFIILGSKNNNNAHYNYTVQLRVKDADGKVVATVENPLVSMFKPKKEGTKVQHELSIALEESNS